MDKAHIIREIQRTAAANGGKPLGKKQFANETGIGTYEWYPHHWLRWSDALEEAGYSPNQMAVAYTPEFLLEKLALLTRELARVPIQGDLLRAAKRDPTFPSDKALRRLGFKAQRRSSMIAYCDANAGFEDVATLWRQVTVKEPAADVQDAGSPQHVGYVYLMKHGSSREYKIGRTNNPIRREGEIGIQLPETLQPVHYIKTDDPAGVERYWHLRFADKRKEGEWFALTSQDVRAFKRWKRIF